MDLAACKGSAYKWFKEACGVLGWTMDPEKDHVPAVALPLLGNIEDWSKTDLEDVFLVRPKEERIQQLTETAKSLLVAKHCPEK